MAQTLWTPESPVPASRSSRPRVNLASALALPALTLIAAFVVIPMLLLLDFSLHGTLQFGGPLTLSQFAAALGSSMDQSLLLKSVGTGLAATGLALALAWPTAYALAKLTPPARRQFWLAVVIIPLLTSALLLIYSMIVLLQAQGPLMSLLSWIGVNPSATLDFTPQAVVLMLAYESIPFMVLTLYNTIDQIDNRLFEAARSLGANRWQVFWEVLAPLSVPGILVGSVLVLPPAIGAFVEAQILGGPNGYLYGNLIQDDVVSLYEPSQAAALAIIMLVAVAVILGVLFLLVGRQRWRQGMAR
jgi:spermidine/putrescine transport system permease protein